MPIYEYVCSGCGSQFEALVRGNEKPWCPSCGRRKLAKQLSVPAAHTAGSEPACPAREVGACQASSCSSDRCTFGGLS